MGHFTEFRGEAIIKKDSELHDKIKNNEFNYLLNGSYYFFEEENFLNIEDYTDTIGIEFLSRIKDSDDNNNLVDLFFKCDGLKWARIIRSFELSEDEIYLYNEKGFLKRVRYEDDK